MREIFKPAPSEPADPGRVFYTITTEDVGKIRISTEIGTIHVRDIMGRVREIDVGKRLYRVPVNGGIDHQPVTWFWQAESDAQRDARLAQTPAQPECARKPGRTRTTLSGQDRIGRELKNRLRP